MPKLCYMAAGKKCSYRLYSEEELSALCLNVRSGNRLDGNFPLSVETRHLNIRCGGITYMLPLYAERHPEITHPLALRSEGKTWYAGYWKSGECRCVGYVGRVRWNGFIKTYRADFHFVHFRDGRDYWVRMPWLDAGKTKSLGHHVCLHSGAVWEHSEHFSSGGKDEIAWTFDKFEVGDWNWDVSENWFFSSARMEHDPHGTFFVKGNGNKFWIEQTSGWYSE